MKKIDSPLNIWSGSNIPFAAALTNPTSLAKQKGNLKNDYPIHVFDVRYSDVETAYQTLKIDCDEDPGTYRNARLNLMATLVTIKLIEHPKLFHTISKKGGSDWIISCSHEIPGYRNSDIPWTGKGLDSAFIAILNYSYCWLRSNEQFYGSI